MAIIKCKMCGGDLALIQGQSVAECEYCGSRQTVPAADDEKRLTLFARAERLRKGCEFDKAAAVYGSIVTDFPEEAEAYWGSVLCRYGIEYVDDPATGKKIPTCHRSSFDSVMDDPDLEQVLENADVAARRVYREEAKQIEELRKGIIAVSANEAPYDIFICYKETDTEGDRTLDSVLAQDIYDALTGRGYRVFFSRISLEDKLGLEYEPYIFAALNSAKIMLAVGTDYEYYNAVWVKNEWSRYLKLMTRDREKHLIPCFKGLDAYDLPREFAKLQAQDLGKVGAIQDLLRGIEKLLPREQAQPAESASGASGTALLLRRASLFLEEGNWKDAAAYCERALDTDPECAEAYLMRAMAQTGVVTRDKLSGCSPKLLETTYWRNALRFADAPLRAFLEDTARKIRERDAAQKQAAVYSKAKNGLLSHEPSELTDAAALFRSLGDYKDAQQLALRCEEKAAFEERQRIFASIMKGLRSAGPDQEKSALRSARARLTELGDHPGAAEELEKVLARLRELADQEERQRREQEAIWDANWDSYVHRARNEQLPYPLEELAGFLDGLGDYRDAPALAALCRSRAEQIRTEEAKLRQKEREREDAIRQKRMRKNRKTSVSMLVTGLLLWIVGGVLMLEYFTAQPNADTFTAVFSLILLLLTGAVIQLPPVLLTFLGLTLSSHGKRGGGLCVTGLVLSILGFLGCGLLTALTGMMSYAEPDGAEFLPIFYGLVAYTLTHIATTVHAALHKRV